MKKLLLGLLLISGLANAQWKSLVSADDFTDEVSSIPYVIGKSNDSTYDKPALAYYINHNRLSIVNSGYYIDDHVTITYRIDKNQPKTINIDIIDRTMLSWKLTEELLNELKEGTSLAIKESEDFSIMKFSLIGFTKEFNKAE